MSECIRIPSNALNLVFKKTSSNGKLSIYLSKHDFMDDMDTVEPIDGVILVDPDYLKGRKNMMLLCSPDCARACNPTASRKKDKWPCGVDFEVKSFCAENLEEKISKSDSVQVVVREVHYSILEPGSGPWAQTIRCFFLSVQAWMDREVHYHGESTSIHISINNCTSKVIKRIKIPVDQITDVVLYSLNKYMKTVFTQEFTETVAANSSFSQSFTETPLLAANCQKQGLALAGKLIKHEDTNLASSTVLRPGMDKELLVILVSYKVKVNLMVYHGGILRSLPASEVGVELPLTLIHPKTSHELLRHSCFGRFRKDQKDTSQCSEDIVIEEFMQQEHGEAES